MVFVISRRRIFTTEENFKNNSSYLSYTQIFRILTIIFRRTYFHRIVSNYRRMFYTSKRSRSISSKPRKLQLECILRISLSAILLPYLPSERYYLSFCQTNSQELVSLELSLETTNTVIVLIAHMARD